MFERELLNSCNKVKFDTYCGYSLYLISLYTYSFGWPFLCPTPATKFIIFLFVQGCRLFRKSNKSQITHKCVLKKSQIHVDCALVLLRQTLLVDLKVHWIVFWSFLLLSSLRQNSNLYSDNSWSLLRQNSLDFILSAFYSENLKRK